MGYNPSTGDMVEGVPADISRILRRRYFLVEKARNANIIGKLPEPDPCLHAQILCNKSGRLSSYVLVCGIRLSFSDSQSICSTM